ncbi:hypothetical protein PN462_19815 [Spirulina sp. CS-785/01]|uniref:hypothetical protein n=1 Tax=Spirulina sp. CS-785/01 TaxID=3021716 RepID=UPI00232B2EBE|nr:hypothetical protein [Spirulina sp. CS-785/01]MDB9315372.1 hypothetical protein [Spirulina sp. CS-785/01]
MTEITRDLIQGKVGNLPLVAYPWKEYADRLILWAKGKSSAHSAFAFDVLMSLAFIDTIPNLQKHFQVFNHLPRPYNVHIGFINLCTPLLLSQQTWHYQKAAKPQSGAIGKLTSEIILRFIELLFDNLTQVKSIGGVGMVDAVLHHQDGRIILCEIKASPLTTFSFLFALPSSLQQNPKQLTRTQVESVESALYLHCNDLISLGKPRDELWPFAPAINYLVNEKNSQVVEHYVETWKLIRQAYKNKNRDTLFYYVANASGQPPKIAKEQFNWPTKQSISDSKTSAGLDRTDDIKKGIYQTFKLSIEGAKRFPQDNIKTALISNLPAYRHGQDYIEPFYDIFWSPEDLLQENEQGQYTCNPQNLKRPFDYILALDDAFTRNELI